MVQKPRQPRNQLAANIHSSLGFKAARAKIKQKQITRFTHPTPTQGIHPYKPNFPLALKQTSTNPDRNQTKNSVQYQNQNGLPTTSSVNRA
jgi:hypothetical protein